MTLEVLQPGQRVSVGQPDSPISGQVRQVAIYDGNQVMYEIAYWSKDERKTCWCYEFEVRPDGEPEKVQIGFKPT